MIWYIITYIIGFILVWWMDKGSNMYRQSSWQEVGIRLLFSIGSWLSLVCLVIYTIWPKPPKFM